MAGDVNVVVTIQAANGLPRTAWQGANLVLNGGRSAFCYFMVNGGTPAAAVYLEVGSGSAVSSAQTSAPQYRIFGTTTAHYGKLSAYHSALGASGFTARIGWVLGPAQFTGTIRELLTTFNPVLNAAPRHTRALVNGGTGIAHNSGETMLVTWDFTIGTGQQPF